MPKLDLLRSRLSKNAQGSEIRKLLNQAGKIEVSMGGGYPHKDSFPVNRIRKIINKLAEEKNFSDLLQYGPTEGYGPFVSAVIDFLKLSPSRKFTASAENILVTTGSQQAINLLAALLINPGDKIAVERPSYLGALQSFNYFEPQYVEIPTDNFGIIPDVLEEKAKKNKIKFLYLVPTFQNPTGKTIPRERKKILAKIAIKYDFYIIEDEPYSEISYEGGVSPSMVNYAPENVIHLFTFSKTLAPGFRLGGLVGPTDVRDAATILKQATDLYTSNLTQAIAAEYILSGAIWKHIPEVIKLYLPNRNELVSAFEKYLPDEFGYTNPQGGMFSWVFQKPNQPKTRKRINPLIIRDLLLAKGIALVPGTPFFANPKTAEVSWRLNFTNPSRGQITSSIKIFCEILKNQLA